METEPTITELAEHFDVHDPAVHERVYEIFEAMRANGDIHWVDARGGYWIVTGYQALFDTAQDWKTFSNALGLTPDKLRASRLVPVELDPPLHRSWRKVLNPLFSPQEAAALEPVMREIANELIDEFAGDGSCNLVSAYAQPLQAEVFFRCVFGLDPEEVAYARAAATQSVFSEDTDGRRAGFAKVSEFCAKLYAERAERGTSNPILRLLDEGDIDGDPIEERDGRGVLEMLVFGGNETTVNALSNVMLYLASNPGDRDRLVADPTMIPHAIEESLRIDSPVVALGRTAARDIEFCGQHLEAGQNVQLAWMSANRDPRAFDDPDTFDMDRNPNNHTSFGVGPHRCLGSHLARTILKVGVSELLHRLPDYRLTAEAEITHRMGEARGPMSVPVEFTPVAPRVNGAPQ